ncbi:MAG: rRNA maturation RNase YbeY [Breznakia sp.]
MKVNIINEYDFVFEYEQIFQNILSKTKERLNIEKPYILSCVFVDCDKIRDINNRYRNINKSTDVISFASLDDGKEVVCDGEIELGDIFICIDTCRKQATIYGHSFVRELCFLFTHGVLHLLGYDHLSQEDETIMFSLQGDILDEIISR